MRSLWPLLTVAMALGCATGPDAAAALLDGRVTRGPVTPVCIESMPCDLPFAGEFDVERRGRRVARFQSDDQGRFQIMLAPGEYTVRWIAGGLGFFGQVQPVSVRPPSTTVELHFDTGIR